MANGTQQCPLPYPGRFQAAVAYASKLPEDAKLTEETKLLLHALYQQATVGPCNEPRPWGWNVVSNAKWQSWKQLGDLAGSEAMRLYVRTLEEEAPGWWTPEFAEAWEARGAAEAADAAPAPAPPLANGAAAANGAPAPPPATRGDLIPSRSAVNAAPPAKSRSVAEVVVEGSWVSPFIASDRRPPPRYEHAVALLGNQLVVVGGNCGGRYLSDTWALNLENLSWSCLSASGRAHATAAPDGGKAGGEEGGALLAPPAAGLPPVAGHAAVGWNGSVIVIGGHTKAQDATLELPVRLLDAAAGTWSLLDTSTAAEGGGEQPRARGGHSATLLGSKVYVFGGEGLRRKSLGELWTLDLSTLEWARPQASGTPPSPRSAHSAVPYRGRYILYFGGGSVATCYNDLHVLDTQSLEWSRPAAEGPAPPPRAGHAAAVLGSTLYVVGGGNNASGCADMYSLDLSALGQGPLRWALVGNTPPEAAIASEGLSLLSVPMAGCMVSFGGYNGRYHNAVHVYRPEGYLAVKQPPPAAAPPAATPGRAGAPPAARPSPEPAAPDAAAVVAAELEAARREAAAAKEAVALEVSIMRRQLDTSTSALQESERKLEEAREALAAEQQRAVALEVEVAELKQQLGRLAELERDVARYRQRAEAEAARKPGSLWGYIAGEPAAASR